MSSETNKPVDEVSEISESKPDEVVSEKPESNWFERGEFPPVGVEVEVNHNGRWLAAFTVGLFGGSEKCMVCAPNGGGFYGFSLDEFRPIRTERENVIEAAMIIANQCQATDQVVYALHKAEMLVLPPKKSDTED